MLTKLITLTKHRLPSQLTSLGSDIANRKSKSINSRRELIKLLRCLTVQALGVGQWDNLKLDKAEVSQLEISASQTVKCCLLRLPTQTRVT